MQQTPTMQFPQPFSGFKRLSEDSPAAGNGDDSYCSKRQHLPAAGWKFVPNDEELVFSYLKPKIEQKPLPVGHKILNVNIYNHHPDTLSAEYEKGNDVEWFFFTPRDKKYPKGERPNRKAIGGFWKASGKYEGIYFKGQEIGKKRSLVFHNGVSPNGERTDWLMKEYCCTAATPPPSKKTDEENKTQLDYVLCKIYKKKAPKNNAHQGNNDGENRDVLPDNPPNNGDHQPAPIDQQIQPLPQSPVMNSMFTENPYYNTFNPMVMENPYYDTFNPTFMENPYYNTLSPMVMENPMFGDDDINSSWSLQTAPSIEQLDQFYSDQDNGLFHDGNVESQNNGNVGLFRDGNVARGTPQGSGNNETDDNGDDSDSES